jgi:DNA-binding NarL/FixJ family response regulator
VSGTRLKVLLGEDNPAILQETRNLLADEFELAGAAENGTSLVAAAQRINPDIVVADIRMPELDGIEACRRILELRCCRAAVILSVSNSPELVNAAFDAGISAYVLKDDAGEELIRAIYAAVQGKGFVSSGIHSHPAILY